MDLQEAFDAGFEHVAAFVEERLAEQAVRIPQLVTDSVAAAIAALPAAKDGADGRDGKDGVDGAAGKDAEPVTDAQIAEQVRLYLEANPPARGERGERGEKGDPGEPGRDGKDGIDGVAGERGERGDAGDQGPPGDRGPAGFDGKDGADGRDGADGVGLAGAVIDRGGHLIVTNTAGAQFDLGLVVGKDGEPGFGLDDFDVTRPDARTMVLSFTRGERKDSFEIGLEHPIYRGVFKEGETYKPGDMTTWAGSLWHCDAETTLKPGEGSADWTLAAKRGRDGKSVEVAKL